MPRKGDKVYLTIKEMRSIEEYARMVQESNRKAGFKDNRKSLSASVDIDIIGFMGEYAAAKLFCINYDLVDKPGPTRLGDLFIMDEWYDVKTPEKFGGNMSIPRTKENSVARAFLGMDGKGDVFVYTGMILKPDALQAKYRRPNVNGDGGYYYSIPQGDLR